MNITDMETVAIVYFILGLTALGITLGVFYAIRCISDIKRGIEVLLYGYYNNTPDIPKRRRRRRSDKSDDGGTQ